MDNNQNTANEKNIAFCGLCCSDCHGYQQKILDLARDLRKELRNTKYKKFADFIATYKFGQAYKDYDKCYELLGAMLKFRCKACKTGGGTPFCKMRQCCQKKGFDGCWQCDDFENCSKLNFLIPVHGDAHIKNLILLKKKGEQEFLKNKRNW
jgi:hypothetical protein